MDTIDNQLEAAERRWTKDDNDDYDRDYVDDRGKDVDNNDRQGGSFEMAAGEGTRTIATATTMTSWIEAGDGGGGRGRGQEAEALTPHSAGKQERGGGGGCKARRRHQLGGSGSAAALVAA